MQFLDPFGSCGGYIERPVLFFLYCSNYSSQRNIFFDKISNMLRSLLNQNDSNTVQTFLFVSNGLHDKENALIIESTVEYIKSLIDSRSPDFIFFSCLVIYIIFYALLRHQGYVLCNLLFLRFFISLLCILYL